MHKKKWNPEVVENLKAEGFNRLVYEQVLEELGALIYSDLCQLPKDSSLDSLNNEPKPLEEAA